MDYPQARVAEVCKLSAIDASKLREDGRNGNLSALADWTVTALYRNFRTKEKLSHRKAVEATASLLSITDLQLSVTEGDDGEA